MIERVEKRWMQVSFVLGNSSVGGGRYGCILTWTGRLELHNRDLPVDYKHAVS